MGNGKGKTTAALGLGLRAAGRGLHVKMVQFMKGVDSGELHAVKLLDPYFKIVRFQQTSKFIWALSKAEREQLQAEVQAAWAWVLRETTGEACDLLVLDEILAVIENDLLDLESVLNLIKQRPAHVEIVLTGRNLPMPLLEAADLVTEMNEVKHYYHAGIAARRGIEY